MLATGVCCHWTAGNAGKTRTVALWEDARKVAEQAFLGEPVELRVGTREVQGVDLQLGLLGCLLHRISGGASPNLHRVGKRELCMGQRALRDRGWCAMRIRTCRPWPWAWPWACC